MPMRSATLLLKIIKNKKQTNSQRAASSWKIFSLLIFVPILFIYLQGTAFLNLFYNRRFWLRHYGSIMHLHKISPRSKREGEPKKIITLPKHQNKNTSKSCEVLAWEETLIGRYLPNGTRMRAKSLFIPLLY